MSPKLIERVKSALESVSRALDAHEAVGPVTNDSGATVALPYGDMDFVQIVLAEVLEEAATRRSMIDETVKALRSNDVRVRPPEMRAISNMSADLRNGLTAMPDDTPGRESVVRAARTLYDTLGAIVARDRSWT